MTENAQKWVLNIPIMSGCIWLLDRIDDSIIAIPVKKISNAQLARRPKKRIHCILRGLVWIFFILLAIGVGVGLSLITEGADAPVSDMSFFDLVTLGDSMLLVVLTPFIVGMLIKRIGEELEAAQVDDHGWNEPARRVLASLLEVFSGIGTLGFVIGRLTISQWDCAPRIELHTVHAELSCVGIGLFLLTVFAFMFANKLIRVTPDNSTRITLVYDTTQEIRAKLNQEDDTPRVSG